MADVFDDPNYRDSLIREMAEEPLYDPIEVLPLELNDF
jgi:hypothetical protein|tara:strand:+ start:1049 stop:1162 length:114 start_codon:yes stop_codon:yes gene_type:complete